MLSASDSVKQSCAHVRKATVHSDKANPYFAENALVFCLKSPGSRTQLLGKHAIPNPVEWTTAP